MTLSIAWGNQNAQIGATGGSTPLITYCDIGGGYPGTGNFSEDPIFATSGARGYFLSPESPCVDLDGAPSPGDVYQSGLDGPVSYAVLTTRTDFAPDGGPSIDLGFHYDPRRTHTLSAELTCLPAAGTLPFGTMIEVRLTNSYPGQLRRMAGRIDVRLANGSSYSNWRNGYTNLYPGATFLAYWVQQLPPTGSLVGENLFQLLAEDVTPSPYNQPPYPAAGFTDSDSCRVRGIAP
jgi:hypothetical protein